MNSRTTSVILASALLLGMAVVQAMDADPKLADPVQQATYERITSEVRCLVCQNQTIADSTAPLAADLRRQIHAQIAAGQTEEEIKLYLLARYGDFVLYRPRFKPSTAVLWLAPALLLLLGGFTLRRIILRRATLPVPADEEGPPAGA